MFIPIIYQQRRDWIHSCVSAKDTILEVGCEKNPIWGGTHFKVTTVDIKPSYQPDIVASAENIPVENGSFDVVCLAEILEHVKDPSVVINEALRICRSKIVITIPNEHEWFVNAKPFTHPDHLRYYDSSSIIGLMKEFRLKFEITKVYIPGWSWFCVQLFKDNPIDTELNYCADKLYCTADQIGIESGAGAVTSNELVALNAINPNTRIEVINGEMIRLDKFEINDDPFLVDYHADEIVTQILKNNKIRFAHFYSSSFNKTVRTLQKAGAFVSFSFDVHDKDTSVEEFGRMGMNYPYMHITDPRLWKIYTAGHLSADLVICSSTNGAEIMRSLGCKNVHVISHGTYLPEEVKPIPSTFQVSYLGQVGPDKGLLYLLAAWKKLGLKDATLVLAGRNIPNVMAWIRDIGGDNIKPMGWVDDKAKIYDECSVYVQPSVTEGFGIEILESMSYGRPVIASVGAGASEIVDDGINGFTVPIRNVDAIAERIKWCYDNRDKLKEMGDNGRKKAQKFSWDTIREEYIRVWRQYLE
jgi:glycosyltransferase involved in cell wall biosynthesis